MNDNAAVENIIRRRMHGLYLTRQCDDLLTLAHDLMGLHSWFFRNAPFSALIRGADIRGWRTALTKTWLYRGTLHGVAYEDLPELLAVSVGENKDGYYSWLENMHGTQTMNEIIDEVVRLMEDGVCSRTEFRQIFYGRYEKHVIDHVFSPWGGVFVCLARAGKVAFTDMTSRDFELINAEPTQSYADVLPGLLRRYFTAYGPATYADAAWFFGISKEDAKGLPAIQLDGLQSFAVGKREYFYIEDESSGGSGGSSGGGSDEPFDDVSSYNDNDGDGSSGGGDEGNNGGGGSGGGGSGGSGGSNGGGSDSISDIPELTLLSGFDPIIASYVADDRLIIPADYKKRVILSSGICLPTIAVNGYVAGLWNIKNNKPVVEFFNEQPRRIVNEATERVESIIWRMRVS